MARTRPRRKRQKPWKKNAGVGTSWRRAAAALVLSLFVLPCCKAALTCEASLVLNQQVCYSWLGVQFGSILYFFSQLQVAMFAPLSLLALVAVVRFVLIGRRDNDMWEYARLIAIMTTICIACAIRTTYFALPEDPQLSLPGQTLAITAHLTFVLLAMLVMWEIHVCIKHQAQNYRIPFHTRWSKPWPWVLVAICSAGPLFIDLVVSSAMRDGFDASDRKQCLEFHSIAALKLVSNFALSVSLAVFTWHFRTHVKAHPGSAHWSKPAGYALFALFLSQVALCITNAIALGQKFTQGNEAGVSMNLIKFYSWHIVVEFLPQLATVLCLWTPLSTKGRTRSAVLAAGRTSARLARNLGPALVFLFCTIMAVLLGVWAGLKTCSVRSLGVSVFLARAGTGAIYVGFLGMLVLVHDGLATHLQSFFLGAATPCSRRYRRLYQVFFTCMIVAGTIVHVAAQVIAHQRWAQQVEWQRDHVPPEERAQLSHLLAPGAVRVLTWFTGGVGVLLLAVLCVWSPVTWLFKMRFHKSFKFQRVMVYVFVANVFLHCFLHANSMGFSTVIVVCLVVFFLFVLDRALSQKRTLLTTFCRDVEREDRPYFKLLRDEYDWKDKLILRFHIEEQRRAHRPDQLAWWERKISWLSPRAADLRNLRPGQFIYLSANLQKQLDPPDASETSGLLGDRHRIVSVTDMSEQHAVTVSHINLRDQYIEVRLAVSPDPEAWSYRLHDYLDNYAPVETAPTDAPFGAVRIVSGYTSPLGDPGLMSADVIIMVCAPLSEAPLFSVLRDLATKITSSQMTGRRVIFCQQGVELGKARTGGYKERIQDDLANIGRQLGHQPKFFTMKGRSLVLPGDENYTHKNFTCCLHGGSTSTAEFWGGIAKMTAAWSQEHVVHVAFSGSVKDSDQLWQALGQQGEPRGAGGAGGGSSGVTVQADDDQVVLDINDDPLAQQQINFDKVRVFAQNNGR